MKKTIEETDRKTCLKRHEVVDIILSCAGERAQSVDALYDKVVKKIAGRYYFSSDCTLDDMIAVEVARGNLMFNRDTSMITLIMKGGDNS